MKNFQFYRLPDVDSSERLKDALDAYSGERVVLRVTPYGGNPPRSILNRMIPRFHVDGATICFGDSIPDCAMVVGPNRNFGNEGGYLSVVSDDETRERVVDFLENLVEPPIVLKKVSKKIVENVRERQYGGQ